MVGCLPSKHEHSGSDPWNQACMAGCVCNPDNVPESMTEKFNEKLSQKIKGGEQMRGHNLMLTSCLHGYVHTLTLTNTYNTQRERETAYVHTHTNKYIQHTHTTPVFKLLHSHSF